MLDLDKMSPPASELPCALPWDQLFGVHEVSRFLPWPRLVPPPCSLLLHPRAHEEGIPLGCGPLNQGALGSLPDPDARSSLEARQRSGVWVAGGVEGEWGRREGTEGRRQERGVKPGSLAVYPNDFLFRPETPMRQDQTALQAVRVGRRECVCVPFARGAL